MSQSQNSKTCNQSHKQRQNSNRRGQSSNLKWCEKVKRDISSKDDNAKFELKETKSDVTKTKNHNKKQQQGQRNTHKNTNTNSNCNHSTNYKRNNQSNQSKNTRKSKQFLGGNNHKCNNKRKYSQKFAEKVNNFSNKKNGETRCNRKNSKCKKPETVNVWKINKRNNKLKQSLKTKYNKNNNNNNNHNNNNNNNNQSNSRNTNKNKNKQNKQNKQSKQRQTQKYKQSKQEKKQEKTERFKRKIGKQSQTHHYSCQQYVKTPTTSNKNDGSIASNLQSVNSVRSMSLDTSNTDTSFTSIVSTVTTQTNSVSDNASDNTSNESKYEHEYTHCEYEFLRFWQQIDFKCPNQKLLSFYLRQFIQNNSDTIKYLPKINEKYLKKTIGMTWYHANIFLDYLSLWMNEYFEFESFLKTICQFLEISHNFIQKCFENNGIFNFRCFWMYIENEKQLELIIQNQRNNLKNDNMNNINCFGVSITLWDEAAKWLKVEQAYRSLDKDFCCYHAVKWIPQQQQQVDDQNSVSTTYF